MTDSDEFLPMRPDLLVRIAVLEERLRANEKATELQGLEYERRLTELNHAHDKQVEDQQTYVSLDKFDGFVAEMSARLGQVQKTLATLEGHGLGGKPLRDIGMILVGAVIAYAAAKLGGSP